MNRLKRAVIGAACSAVAAMFVPTASAQSRMENLGRGVAVVNQGEGKAFVTWRMLGTDPDNIAFNLYRSTGGAAPVKINNEPLTKATSYQDSGVDLTKENAWFVRPIVNGQEGEMSKPFLNKIAAGAAATNYHAIPTKTPQGYSINDTSVGDLDGDGEYEMFLKTADGTVDGAGTVIGDANADWVAKEGSANHRDTTGSVRGTDGQMVTNPDGTHVFTFAGRILSGPEYLTVFDGMTGKALATTNYVPALGKQEDWVKMWGDGYGNRSERYLAAVAYLDGNLPSAVMCRGYYHRATLAAWDWRGGKLTMRWLFDSKDGTPGNDAYGNQGNHNLSVADVDEDGKDEIIYGACSIDDNGKGIYTTGLGHGDALHVSDMDPNRPGLEIFDIHENPQHAFGMEYRDARTGKMIWGFPGGTQRSRDVGRGVAYDIDPRHPGYEMWSSLGGLYNAKGEKISDRQPNSVNFCIWWDGDLLREGLNGNTISKWNWETNASSSLFRAEGAASNNGSKSTPALSGDIFGDWREELILRNEGNTELRVYTTTIPTEHRFYTLMHDRQYRNAIAWQNVAYNQPPHPSFFLGDGMKPAPKPNITTAPLTGQAR